MIGIISAMAQEMESIRSLLTQPQEETVGSVRFLRGFLENKPVVTAVCGVGKVHAALCAQTMILHFSPDMVINTGVAGCLAGGIAIGDVVVAENAVQHDMDTVTLGDAPGLISGLDIVKLPCAPELTQALVQSVTRADGKVHRGTIATGDQFIHDTAKKRWIHETFGALCCEMEGGSIAQVCLINGVPCGILRAISDNADGDAPENFLEFLLPAAEKTAQALRVFCETFG